MERPLLVEATCHLIDDLLPEGYPGIEEVARLLSISPRTIQRRLCGAGMSYSDLVDRCRCRAACEALQQTREPIQDISAKLGFTDASSFASAFRRWTGISPRAYRRQSLQFQPQRPEMAAWSPSAISRTGPGGMTRPG